MSGAGYILETSVLKREKFLASGSLFTASREAPISSEDPVLVGELGDGINYPGEDLGVIGLRGQADGAHGRGLTWGAVLVILLQTDCDGYVIALLIRGQCSHVMGYRIDKKMIQSLVIIIIGKSTPQ